MKIILSKMIIILIVHKMKIDMSLPMLIMVQTNKVSIASIIGTGRQNWV